jgi:hypothetical protein
MVPLKRWLYNSATWVSLVLCMATVVLAIAWMLSYRWPINIVLTRESRYGVGHDHGALFINAYEAQRWHRVLTVTYWWMVVAVAAMQAVLFFWGRSRWVNRVRRLGLCTTCGYDLRATPERCPECGTVRKSSE